MARIGSQGTATDLYVLLQQACYEPAHGHEWNPPAEIEEKLDASVHAYDAGYRIGHTVPWSPKCKDCRRIGKRNMSRRGVPQAQIEKLFALLGARWTWKSVLQPKEDKREYAYDDNGQYRLASAIKSGQRQREERALRRTDRMAQARDAIGSGVYDAVKEHESVLAQGL